MSCNLTKLFKNMFLITEMDKIFTFLAWKKINLKLNIDLT